MNYNPDKKIETYPVRLLSGSHGILHPPYAISEVSLPSCLPVASGFCIKVMYCYSSPRRLPVSAWMQVNTSSSTVPLEWQQSARSHLLSQLPKASTRLWFQLHCSYMFALPLEVHPSVCLESQLSKNCLSKTFPEIIYWRSLLLTSICTRKGVS